MDELWRLSAREAMDAARALTAERWRAMANRLYYAMYAETHARLIAAGLRPRRALGTWRHEELPKLVRKHLGKPLGKDKAARWSRALRNARQLREAADYQPQSTVDASTLVRAMNRVSEFVGGES